MENHSVTKVYSTHSTRSQALKRTQASSSSPAILARGKRKQGDEASSSPTTIKKIKTEKNETSPFAPKEDQKARQEDPYEQEWEQEWERLGDLDPYEVERAFASLEK
ncbi:hypothetical protein BCR41DRAFT_398571 [Lobosporangium transversale]|uniref:Uncharacterized protein n=1 Tax=Lobosporangium transversale TaxID=64571 RepID=A0A1Y2GIF3_9FUNG|nr:hypothetical protein BCR41DRAFT_402393 [Lobosporangium transversale]XP_021875320.1 hypothetical protein BCR41DRAFT_402380 [Lobosporangium transversale]XP_021875976.1 hypothetical protein BCR41DRAFT_401583 [Lobosporangium transversale]XP_021879113.1 hypothetical protein BCR41DRAFT_398571 [Lobosporangium transversale]ORY94356.1 hypothetical protein BCR41DRAFT_402393 [Lobosporangium transversale]ORY95111.1 hypothetical protein BCR41DRAFT_402380 [Lobosporangium transversale]ORY99742.1 hypothet|eukprot:XP_021875296.1 hypothetical protein BCR41DRAFT_402393 [Lobosporangium transversale]